MDLKLSNFRYAYIGNHGINNEGHRHDRGCLVAESEHGAIACVIREELKLVAYGYDLAPLGNGWDDIVPRIDFYDPDFEGGNGIALPLDGFTDDPEWCARCRLFMVHIDHGGFRLGPAPDLGPTGWRRWYRRSFGDDGLFSG